MIVTRSMFYRLVTILFCLAFFIPAHSHAATTTFDGTVIPAEDVEVLPDLIPLASKDLHFGTVNGRTVLRFTSIFWNSGGGRLELVAGSINGEAGELVTTVQRLVRKDGTVRDVVVGDFFWHDIHNHYHFENFADTTLELVAPESSGVQIAPVITFKASFCLRDDVYISPGQNGTSDARTFVSCGKERQGVSVGWADRYGYELPDQYIDVHDLPAGIYRLTFRVDPNHHFLESDQANNLSVIYLSLNPGERKFEVLASAAPSAFADNTFRDGLLVKAQGLPFVYEMHGNKKRWLPSEEVFLSYGFSWGDVLEFPAEIIRAIPNVPLLRDPSTGAIFSLNNAGHKRRILSPEVLAAYSWGSADMVNVNQTELASHPESTLAAVYGSTEVFSLTSKSRIGALADLPGLGYDPLSVHMINETDFLSYARSSVAEDLNIPWDVGFLPGGDMLVTERTGTLRRIGARSESFVVSGVMHQGEGGLMGIAVHPNFAQNQFVYLYFTTAENSTSNALVRYRLTENALTQDRVILDNIPGAPYHDGGQIAFGPDGNLFIATGDASQSSLAQNTQSLAGKILRVRDDGSIPSDNPFGNAVWSYGHRNVQGIAWDLEGNMWATEHGRSGASSGYDELNLIERGANYGWPEIQGDESNVGMRAPILHSGASTTWAPSGITYKNGTLYFSGLLGSRLYAVSVSGGRVTSVREHLTDMYGRLRAATIGPDGMLYLTTSNRDGRGTVRSGDDRVIKIVPEMLDTR